MKHPHAELMLQYAQDAMETQTPWERWEFRLKELDEKWQPFGAHHPAWHEHYEYRRKPRTIRIGNYDVPEPMRSAPKVGTTYWVFDVCFGEQCREVEWDGNSCDEMRFNAGFCHATKEAAELHRKALLSFTAKEARP